MGGGGGGFIQPLLLPTTHQSLHDSLRFASLRIASHTTSPTQPQFIIHHVLAGTAAWGSMYPGCGHTYALFYMGISEISTSVLVILANFDDVHGVKGLADAFPTLKIACAVAFVVAFITCRIVMWPWVSKVRIKYYKG